MSHQKHFNLTYLWKKSCTNQGMKNINLFSRMRTQNKNENCRWNNLEEKCVAMVSSPIETYQFRIRSILWGYVGVRHSYFDCSSLHRSVSQHKRPCARLQWLRDLNQRDQVLGDGLNRYKGHKRPFVAPRVTS